MKTLRSLGAILLLALAFTSCTKKKRPPITGDYLIVGWSGGFVPADAKAKYYRVTEGELWLDTNQVMANIPRDVSFFNFNYQQPADKYGRVADLRKIIPVELMPYHGAHIGKPLVDAGYTDVITLIAGHQYHWYFEADQGGSSAEVQQFVARLNADFH